jgi:hypothetical protein
MFDQNANIVKRIAHTMRQSSIQSGSSILDGDFSRSADNFYFHSCADDKGFTAVAVVAAGVVGAFCTKFVQSTQKVA